MIKPQWFLKTTTMYKRALEAVNEGRLKLTPGFYRREWENWLTNDVDWCLSRQLWWGHRVPAWKVGLRWRNLLTILKIKRFVRALRALPRDPEGFYNKILRN